MKSVSLATRRRVEGRAEGRRDYCRIHQADDGFFRYHVDHIIARQHGGETVEENLALACHFCNRCKGPNLSAIDPESGRTVALFHPRKQEWAEHFRQVDRSVEGITSTGRATVCLLRMNAMNRQALRRVPEK